MADKLSQTSLRSPLGRVRGLGPAREGLAHWWAQRLTSLALVPLSLWFAFSVAGLAGAEQAVVRAWVAAPVNSVLLVVLVATTFHHAQLGLQVVIEDYIHTESTKLATLLAVKAACLLVGLAGILAVLRMALA